MKRKATGMLIGGDNGDLVLNGGSVAVGSTLYQNQYIILKAQKGDIKEHPLLGVGIDDIVNDNQMAGWKKSIRDEFARDGLEVSDIGVAADGSLIINASYR